MEPTILITTYTNKSRALRYFIVEMLKKWLAKSVDRINYVKSYYIQDGEIKKEDVKILIIKTTSDKKEILEKFIKAKNIAPIPQIFYIKPEEINPEYLSRLIWTKQ